MGTHDTMEMRKNALGNRVVYVIPQILKIGRESISKVDLDSNLSE